MSIPEEIETAKIAIDGRITCVVFDSDTILTLELAKKIVQKIVVLSQDNYLLYIDIRNVISIDEPTRKYLAGDSDSKKTIIAAIHVENLLSKFLANFFIQIDKPVHPIELFNQKGTALKWLKKNKDV
jgi:hypothetical protein